MSEFTPNRADPHLSKICGGWRVELHKNHFRHSPGRGHKSLLESLDLTKLVLVPKAGLEPAPDGSLRNGPETHRVYLFRHFGNTFLFWLSLEEGTPVHCCLSSRQRYSFGG